MNKYRYILDRSSKKYLCPNCGKRRFNRYIDTETGEYLPEKYGRCDRSDHCVYFLNPYKDGYAKGESAGYKTMHQPKPQPRKIYFIPEDTLKRTLANYDKNVFIQNLLKLAPVAEVKRVIEMYYLGTMFKGARSGAVTFPFIDISGNIRTIQAKQFDDTNHTISTDFVHSILSRHYSDKGEILPVWLQEYFKSKEINGSVTCLFGEHLLKKYPNNPVALVEAPKTAIIGTLYYGQPETPGSLLWLAVYSKSTLNYEKCKVLQGRNVVLYPDLNAFSEWSAKIRTISANMPGTRFVVSDFLERNASERDILKGLDLADYLTRFELKDFRQQLKQPSQNQPITAPQAQVHSNSLTKEKDALQPTESSHMQYSECAQFVKISPPLLIDTRHDYFDGNMILHIHYPGIPELIEQV